MSVRDEATGLEYAGALGCAGCSPPRPPRRSGVPADAGRGPAVPPPGPRRCCGRSPPGQPVTRPCASSSIDGGFSPYFVRHFMEPLVAAVWSCDPAIALDYPARYLFAFLDHHGMLGRLRLTHVAHRHRGLARVRRPA